MRKVLITCALAVGITAANANDLKCLAQTVYREARGESLDGKLAVAQVVLNRVKHPAYPRTICSVVYQFAQFSWTAKYTTTVPDAESYRVARLAISGKHRFSTFQATHFHSTGIRPAWKLKYLTTIGNHRFYYEKER